jgi:hypothetical protein
MYACVPKIERGFFEGVYAPSNATAHSYDPPHPQRKGTGAPLPGLRPEVVDHTLRYRGRRFNLG